MEVQYIGDTLYLPTLEREVRHIIERDVEQVSGRLHAFGWEKVVRCKDCKRMRDWTADELDSYDEAELADGWCMFFRIGTYDDFFCAWGAKVVSE